MKQYFKSLWQLLSVAVILCSVVSCSDTWDEHYSTNSAVNDANSIASILSQESDASKFVEALKTTKMLKINDDLLSTTFFDFLSADQFVTLWVPSNSSMTEEEWELYTKQNKTEAENVLVAKRLIMNHLARYNHTLSEGNDTTDVLMMNKKHHTLIGNRYIDQSEYKKDSKGNPIVNIACSNGIIHFLSDDAVSGKIPYRPTIFEFLTTDTIYGPLIGNFLDKYTLSYLDEDASVPSSFDDEGRTVYIDSVTYEHNMLLSGSSDFLSYGFGLIDSEDSTFIMVLPSKEGWIAQYELLHKSFDFGIQDTSNDSLQTLWSKTAMIKDAIFNRNLQRNPLDSVCSTQYSFTTYKNKDNIDFHRFMKPYDTNSGIFYKNLLDSVVCSNGVIYITKDWNFDRYSVYNPKLVDNCYVINEKECFIKPKYERIPVLDDKGEQVEVDGKPQYTIQLGGSINEVRNRNVQDGYVLRIGSEGATDAWLGWTFSYMFHDVLAGKYTIKLVVTYGDDDKNPKPINIHPTVYFFYDSDPNKSSYEASTNQEVLLDEKVGPRRRPKVYNNVIEKNGVKLLSDTIVLSAPIEVPYCTYGMKYASLQVNITNTSPAVNMLADYSPFLFLDRIILEPVKE